MDYRYRAVSSVDGTQQGESDGVVTSEGYDARQGLAVLCRAEFFGACHGRAGEEIVVAMFNLLQSPSIVIPDLQSQYPYII